MKKFELTSTTKIWFGKTLYQIKALISFGDVEAGELGGYVEKDGNLSHDGNAWVYGNAQIFGNARVYGNACVFDDARVCGNAWVYDDARVCGNAWVYGDARVCGNARVYGDARVCGNARVFDDARVCGNADYLVVGPIGSRNSFTTLFRCNDKSVKVKCGCFYGTMDEFAAKVTATHGDNAHAKAYRAVIELAKVKFDLAK